MIGQARRFAEGSVKASHAMLAWHPVGQAPISAITWQPAVLPLHEILYKATLRCAGQRTLPARGRLAPLA